MQKTNKKTNPKTKERSYKEEAHPVSQSRTLVCAKAVRALPVDRRDSSRYLSATQKHSVRLWPKPPVLVAAAACPGSRCESTPCLTFYLLAEAERRHELQEESPDAAQGLTCTRAAATAASVLQAGAGEERAETQADTRNMH